MKLSITPIQGLWGDAKMPGDKSISHRSIILSSLARGKNLITGFLESEDCLNTIKAFRNMGVAINKESAGRYIVEGVGLRGLQEPDSVIDCGNSGTCMRILTGLLTPQKFYSVVSGDSSLRQRPMARIIKPLSEMGANIWSRGDHLAPLSIKGSQLHGIDYKLPVASAQVKSSLILAGLYADGDVSLTEPGLSRDHTERMLLSFGVDLKKEGSNIYMDAAAEPRLIPQEIEVPGDISSAAYFMAAALIVPDSKILLKDIGINPTRSGIIEVIKEMNGNIEIHNKRTVSGEPIADILVKKSQLQSTAVSGEIIPRLIDEIPVIAVLAAAAEGKTVIKDAAELRVKETDRIKAVVSELSKMNVDIKELDDGMIIKGPTRFKGTDNLQSYGDHRIAMSLAVAGLTADSKITVNNTQCINTSFPEFEELLSTLY